MEKRTLADRLKELRAEISKPQEEVADEVGISRSYLAGMEAGHSMPGRDTLIALANYYGVSVDWLASEEGEKRPMQPLNEREQDVLRAYRRLPAEEARALHQYLKARAG